MEGAGFAWRHPKSQQENLGKRTYLEPREAGEPTLLFDLTRLCGTYLTQRVAVALVSSDLATNHASTFMRSLRPKPVLQQVALHPWVFEVRVMRTEDWASGEEAIRLIARYGGADFEGGPLCYIERSEEVALSTTQSMMDVAAESAAGKCCCL